MEPKIIYEDDALMVIDKPSGWIVNDATTTKDQPTVQSWLRRNFSRKAGSGSARQFPLAQDKEFRSGIVHRLDKETSGVLLVAKTKAAFTALQSAFKAREVHKTYIALVHRKVEPKEGKIVTTVGRLPWRRDRFGVLPGGRLSESRYKVIKYYSKDKDAFSLVEFYPKTGRTHQIRIHAKYIGHPIVGDEFYAGRKTARRDRIWCPRLFLHASRIVFPSPTTGNRVVVEISLAEDLSKALKPLKASS